jgi:predicted  nucleic acid-binding Zn-ribbon protein
MADDVFRVTKDANGNPVYTHNNQVLSKSEFDQRNAQSTTEMNALKNQKDDFDSEFDDMRAKIQTMKKPVKKAKGGTASSRADGCATKGKTKGRFV